MARARILKPGFFTNELLAELPFEGRLLFAGLWTLADREGRLEDRAKRIKAAVFPFDEVDVPSLLGALEHKGFIERYTVAAMPLIQIAKFSEHQTPHRREPASTLAPSPAFSGTSPAVTGNGSSSVTGNGSDSSTPSAEPHDEPQFPSFSTVGKGPRVWRLMDLQIEEWQRLYPTIRVRAELCKAWAWLKANPGRRKTAGGMTAFCVNWLNRSTDRPRQAVTTTTPPIGSSQRVSASGIVLDCPHEPACSSRWACGQRQLQERAS